MDASTVAQAALALAVDNSRDAALNELLLERERLAIHADDMQSFVAARHFTKNLLTQSPRAAAPRADDLAAPWTWERAYKQRHTDLALAHDALRAALHDVRQGEPERAEQRLSTEVAESSSEEDGENTEESD